MNSKKNDWIINDDTLKSVHMIRQASKKWKEKDWKEYEEFLIREKILFQSYWEILLEHWDQYQRETQFESEFFDEFTSTDNQVADYFTEEDCEKYAQWKKYVKPSLKLLTLKEQDVVFGLFWGRKTESELAREMSISRSTVRDYKKSGIKKIKRFLDEVQKNNWVKKTVQDDFERGGQSLKPKKVQKKFKKSLISSS